MLISFAFFVQGETNQTFVLHRGKRSWLEARQACQAEGGDLASIHSFQEQALAVSLAGGESIWLGIFDGPGQERFVYACDHYSVT